MTYIVKSRWGFFTEPTPEKAKAEAEYINKRDEEWGVEPSAIAYDATPIEDKEEED